LQQHQYSGVVGVVEVKSGNWLRVDLIELDVELASVKTLRLYTARSREHTEGVH